MSTLLTIIHVTTCILMISVILLQQGKGSDIGAAFGGGSHTLFGARGATSFLAKFTTGCAVVFMVTSLSLAIIARGGGSASVVDDMGEVKTIIGDEVVPEELPEMNLPAAPAPAEPTQ